MGSFCGGIPPSNRVSPRLPIYRDLEEIDIAADAMMRSADKVDPFSYDARRAFIVRTSTQAHAARMHKILRAQRNFEILYSLAEAEQWIKS